MLYWSFLSTGADDCATLTMIFSNLPGRSFHAEETRFSKGILLL